MAVLCVTAAWGIGKTADITPRYVRPSSLFFSANVPVPPPVKVVPPTRVATVTPPPPVTRSVVPPAPTPEPDPPVTKPTPVVTPPVRQEVPPKTVPPATKPPVETPPVVTPPKTVTPPAKEPPVEKPTPPTPIPTPTKTPDPDPPSTNYKAPPAKDPPPKETPVVKPPPPPVRDYVAEADLGASVPKDATVELPDGVTLVSSDITEEDKGSVKERKDKRDPIAIAFIADCTGSMSRTDPRLNRLREPARFAASLDRGDVASLMQFNSSIDVVEDWKPGDQVDLPRSAPSEGGSGSTPIQPILDHFSDSRTAGKQKIAVFLGDLGAEDGYYVLKAAQGLAAQGVTVYTIQFRMTGKVNGVRVNAGVPDGLVQDLRRLCRSTGGELYNANTADNIGRMVERIGNRVIERKVVSRHLRVVFRSRDAYRSGDTITARVNGKNVKLGVNP